MVSSISKFKWLITITFIGPLVAIITGNAGNRTALAEAPSYDSKTRQIYVLEHYKMAEPMIVVTVNSFPFDIGGLRPYEINVQGRRYVFDPVHVKEFLAKGKPMNTFHKPLPSGVVIVDGYSHPIDRTNITGDDSQNTVLHMKKHGFPANVAGSRTR